MNTKKEIREYFLKKRKQLSLERKTEATQSILKELLPKLKAFSLILSFASMAEEIDLWSLNKHLAVEERLGFPRLVANTELIPYKVTNCDRQLVFNPKWKFLEPDPEQCLLIRFEQIDCVLVPAVAFDSDYYRLGYGKGHYDRFLPKLSCPFYGVGYKEQLYSKSLPREFYDIPLTKLFLF